MRCIRLRRAMRARQSISRLIGFAGLALVAGGCVLAPHGTRDERAQLAAAGAPFVAPVEERIVPPLPDDPDWRDLLQHAFLVNGDLEAAYWEWAAAAARIDIAAGYPNSNVSLNFSYLFSSENMKAWDRTTLVAGFDPMQNLSLPPKVLAAGRVALAEAQAAGARFAAAKFALQQRLLSAYLDYALLAEKRRLKQADVALLDLLADSAAGRVQAGAAQPQLVDAEVQRRLATNELLDLDAELPQARAMLNALVGRAPDAPLPPPAALPSPRPIAADADMLAAATAANPELRALARTSAGRADAIELARLQYFPDINPFVGITGGIEQVVGAAITLSTTIPQIRAGIAEARAILRQADAMARQTGRERGASFVAALAALRNAERQIAFLQDRVLPFAAMSSEVAARTYTASATPLPELIASQRAVLDVRLLIAEARVMREQRVAELEALAGLDVETLHTAPPAGEEGAPS